MDEENKNVTPEETPEKKSGSFLAKSIIFFIIYAIVILTVILLVNRDSLSNTILMIMNPIIYGLIIAYLCNPILRFFFGKAFKKIKSVYLRKFLSMIVTYIIVLVLLFGVLAVLVEQLVANVQTFLDNVGTYVSNTETAVVDFIEKLPFIKSEAEIKAEKEAKEAAEKAKKDALTEPVVDETAAEPATEKPADAEPEAPAEEGGGSVEAETPVTEPKETIKTPEETQKLSDVIGDISDTTVNLIDMSLTKESVIKFIREALTNSTSLIMSIGDSIVKSGTTAVSVIINFFLGIIFSIYILTEKEMLCAKAKKLTIAIFKPDTAASVLAFSHYSDRKIGHFIRGKIVESVIVGVLAYASFVIFKIPTPLVIAMIVAIMNIIPIFGPFLGAIPAALLVFLIDPSKTIPYIIIVIILMQINGNYISPKIVGTSTGLTPLGAITALILMSGLFGIVGMFIGIPVIAILIEFMWTTMNKRLQEKNLSVELDDYYSPEFAEVLEYEKAKKRRRNLTAFTVDSVILLFKKIFKKDKDNKKDSDKK